MNKTKTNVILNTLQFIFKETIKHIGYTEDSHVYYLETMNKVIKCFPSLKKEEEEVEKDINMLLLSKKDSNKDSSLSCPESIFYIQIQCSTESNKLEEYCCLVLPFYTNDLESVDFFSLFNKDKDENNWIEKKKLIKQLLNGIKELHSYNYYHGDLKLKNICIQTLSSSSSSTLFEKNKDENKVEIKLKIIDYGSSGKLDNKENRYKLKNSANSCTPIQLFHHIKDYLYNCDCENNLCELCKLDIKYSDYIKEILKEKYNRYPIPFFNGTMLTEFYDENCIHNDLFGVSLLIYYITTSSTFFNQGKYADEMITFLKNPEEFVDNKIKFEIDKTELRDKTNKLECLLLFKNYILQYINYLKNDSLI